MESVMAVPGLGLGRKGDLVFTEDGASALQEERVVEMGGDGGSITV